MNKLIRSIVKSYYLSEAFNFNKLNKNAVKQNIHNSIQQNIYYIPEIIIDFLQNLNNDIAENNKLFDKFIGNKKCKADNDSLQTLIDVSIEKLGNECDLNWIDTSKVTDMSYLFDEKNNFNGDISQWNTSSVTTMRSMFVNVKTFNQDISQWNTSSVTNMSYMFCNAESFNQDISGWDTSSVTDMRKMFYECPCPKPYWYKE